MGRFSNLEFGGKELPREEEGGSSNEVRDEKYYLRLGDEDYQSARFERALRYYSRALEFNANLPAAWVGQVQMLVELGEFKEARLWADKALEVHRDHRDILSVKSVAVAREGDPQKALEFSDAAMAQKGSSPLSWLARGEALLAGHRPHDEHCFDRAVSEARHDWFMKLRVARVHHLYGQFARGLSWVQKAVKEQPGSAFALHVMGDCQLALGMSGDAETSYTQALALDRDFVLSSTALRMLKERPFGARLWGRVTAFFRGERKPS
jgi:tetratricopeptide (TPR) repeat protein